MPNEIDVKGLRRAHEILTVYFQHDPKGGCDSEGCTSDCPTVAAREEIDSALPALLDELERLRGEHWTCYHCGKTFTSRALAAEHFGDNRDNPRPAKCEMLLTAISEAFERYGVHRNFHNAASVKILAQRVLAAEAERDALKKKLERVREWAETARSYPGGTTQLLQREAANLVLAILKEG